MFARLGLSCKIVDSCGQIRAISFKPLLHLSQRTRGVAAGLPHAGSIQHSLNVCLTAISFLASRKMGKGHFHVAQIALDVLTCGKGRV